MANVKVTVRNRPQLMASDAQTLRVLRDRYDHWGYRGVAARLHSIEKMIVALAEEPVSPDQPQVIQYTTKPTTPRSKPEHDRT